MTLPKYIQTVYDKRGKRKKFSKKEHVTDPIWEAARHEHGSDKERVYELSNKIMDVLKETAREREDHFNEHEITDIIAEHLMMEEGHLRTADTFLSLAAGQALKRQGVLSEDQFIPDGVPREILRKSKHINRWLEAETIEKLNNHIYKGTFPKLVHSSEAILQHQLIECAEKAVSKGNVKVVVTAGPSAAGKSSVAQLFEMYLAEQHNTKARRLVFDNFFRNRSEQPLDRLGNPKYETPRALMLEDIREVLTDAIAGKKVVIPHYSFKTGIYQRYPDYNDPHVQESYHGKSVDEIIALHEFTLRDDEILIIDSHHGMFPEVTDGIPEDQIFKTFLGVFNYLILEQNNESTKYSRWDDYHLIRRTLRDMKYRDNDNPMKTLDSWHLQRTAVMKYIYPYMGTADYIINSGMPYELPILKAALANQFPTNKYVEEHRPHRHDTIARVKRVNRTLSTIVPYDDMSVVPSHSILREFIGGGSLSVH